MIDIPALKGTTFKALDQLGNRVEQASGAIGDAPAGENAAPAPTPSPPAPHLPTPTPSQP